MSRSAFWTPAREAQLQDMCAQERFTSTEMAAALGCRRGCVIGKAGRMGLKLLSPADPRALARPGIIPPKRPSKPLPPPRPVGASLGVLMEDLRPHHCRYPEGFAPPYRFCGNQVEHGKPYCAGHCAVTFHKPVARMR